MKILLVEPDQKFQQELLTILIAIGNVVTTANCAEEGLDKYRTSKYDLILSSSTLDSDIVKFCVNIKNNESSISSTPLVILTSRHHQSVGARCLISGATDFISKDRPDEIISYISKKAAYLNTPSSIRGKILYIEDETSIALLTTAILEKYNMKVDHFNNATKAISAYNKNEYDMIITDIILQGEINGLSLVKCIRGYEGKKGRIPILAVTGFEDTSRKIELLRSGVNDLLVKPVVAEELGLRAQNLISSKLLLDDLEYKQKQLENMALSDQLTQLYNRHYLFDVAPKRIKEALRHKFDISLLMIDLDFFKKINDKQGHITGDIVLQEVSILIKESCREEDIAARFGGEEFVVLLAHCDFSHAYAKAERLRLEIEELRPSGLRVTASIGIATLDINGEVDFEMLFEQADKAAYVAKESGRNQVSPKLDNIKSTNSSKVA